MIWFDIKELERRLIDGNISDYLAFKYLLVQFVLFNLSGYIPSSDDEPVWTKIFHLIILLTALIWGVSKTFEINKAGDNKDYLKRFLSLSFVTGVRTIVFVLLISFILSTVYLIADKMNVVLIRNSVYKEGLELFFYLLFNAIYYYILITSFKRVNSAGSAKMELEPL